MPTTPNPASATDEAEPEAAQQLSVLRSSEQRYLTGNPQIAGPSAELGRAACILPTRCDG